MKENLKHMFAIALVGMLLGLGMRATEWLIPAPEHNVVHKIDDNSRCLKDIV